MCLDSNFCFSGVENACPRQLLFLEGWDVCHGRVGAVLQLGSIWLALGGGTCGPELEVC